MKITKVLLSLVITAAAGMLVFPLLLLLALALLQALVIESLRKIFQQPVSKNLAQISFHKEAHWQKINLLPRCQHGLATAAKK